MPYRTIKNFFMTQSCLPFLQNYVYRLYDLCVQFELCVYNCRMSWHLHTTWKFFLWFYSHTQFKNMKTCLEITTKQWIYKTKAIDSKSVAIKWITKKKDNGSHYEAWHLLIVSNYIAICMWSKRVQIYSSNYCWCSAFLNFIDVLSQRFALMKYIDQSYSPQNSRHRRDKSIIGISPPGTVDHILKLDVWPRCHEATLITPRGRPK